MELSGSLIKVYHVLFLIINKCMSFSVCVLKNFLSNPISVLTISKVFSQISNFILFNLGEFTNIYKSMYFFKVEWEINGV